MIKNFELVIASDDISINAILPQDIKFLHMRDVEKWRALAKTDRFSYYTYLRLPAIEHLTNRYNKILYLDTDIFIISKKVGEIFDIEMGKHVLCAVRDAQQRFNLKKHVLDFKMNGLERAAYFNAGVLLVNSVNWKNNCTYEKILKTLVDFEFPTRLHDQTLLNLVFHKKWLELSPKWNWMGGPLTNFAADFFSVKMYHGKTWISDPKRVPIRFLREFQLYDEYFNMFENTQIDTVSSEEFYQEYWKSLLLNARWSLASIRWLKRFNDDFDTIPSE